MECQRTRPRASPHSDLTLDVYSHAIKGLQEDAAERDGGIGLWRSPMIRVDNPEEWDRRSQRRRMISFGLLF